MWIVTGRQARGVSGGQRADSAAFGDLVHEVFEVATTQLAQDRAVDGKGPVAEIQGCDAGVDDRPDLRMLFPHAAVQRKPRLVGGLHSPTRGYSSSISVSGRRAHVQKALDQRSRCRAPARQSRGSRASPARPSASPHSGRRTRAHQEPSPHERGSASSSTKSTLAMGEPSRFYEERATGRRT